MNLYTYCGNNPINRWDPSGNNWITDAYDTTLHYTGFRDTEDLLDTISFATMGTGGAVVKGSKLIGQGGKWAYKGGKKYIWDGTKKLWRKMIGEGAANGVNKTRVGQWMSKAEYEQFVKTGEIPRSNVLTKGKEGYMKQANSGDHYVEFDIDSSLLFTKDPNLGS